MKPVRKEREKEQERENKKERGGKEVGEIERKRERREVWDQATRFRTQ